MEVTCLCLPQFIAENTPIFGTEEFCQTITRGAIVLLPRGKVGDVRFTSPTVPTIRIEVSSHELLPLPLLLVL